MKSMKYMGMIMISKALLLSINYLLHSDFDCDSDFIENPLVVRVDLPSGQVEAELEGDEDAELGGQQLPLAHTKHGLDLLQKNHLGVIYWKRISSI